MLRRRFTDGLALFGVLVCAGGCRSHAPVVQPDVSPMLGNALVTGETSKADVVLLWGVPAAVYEDENILTYHMQGSGGVTLQPVWPRPDPHVQPLAPWDRGRLDLILVFDAQQILQRYSLVKVY